MLLAIFFLGICLWTGYAITTRLPVQWHIFELIAVSCILGLFTGSWVALLAIWATGYTLGLAITFCFLSGVSLFLHYNVASQTTWKHADRFSNKKNLWTYSITLGALTIILFQLLFTHMLQEKQGEYYSGGSAWGDLALHLALITRFANQQTFTWDMPIFAGGKLSYPFLVDFTTGILYRLGMNLQPALSIPILLYVIGGATCLFFLSYRAFKHRVAAALFIILFFFNGAIGGLYPFWKDWQASNTSLISFLGDMKISYSHVEADHILFSNIIVDYILPQRSFVSGLAVFSVINILLLSAWQKSNTCQYALIASGVLAGFLPLAHIHTFFVVSGLLVWLVIADMWRQKKIYFSPWLLCLCIMLAIAAPQVMWQVGGAYREGFSYWQTGWMRGENQSIISFWLQNLGLASIFLFTNISLISRLKDNQLFWGSWYGALFTLFILTNIYIFQPNEYDNMKFMIYSYLGIVFFASLHLGHWLEKAGNKQIASISIIISLTIVGLLCVLRESYTSWLFSSQEQITIAEKVRQLTPPEARILTSSQHNNAVPTLTGRRIVMGYPGWLWTYGLDYRIHEQDITHMLTGDPSTPVLLEQYNISYVVIGPDERNRLFANESYFASHGKLIASTNQFSLYDVSALRK